MKKQNIIILMLLMLNIHLHTFSQVEYGVALSGGISNILKLDMDKGSNNSNIFKPKQFIAIDGFIIENISNSRYSFEQGLAIQRANVSVGIPDNIYTDVLSEGIDVDQYWNLSTWKLAVPLKVKYKFEPWLTFNYGIMNSFYLNQYQSLITNVYALGAVVGFDVLLAEHYLLGIQGDIDLLHSGKTENSQIYFHGYNASIRFAVLLSSFNQSTK